MLLKGIEYKFRNICLKLWAAKHRDGQQEFVIGFIGMSGLWEGYQVLHFFLWLRDHSSI